MSWFTAARIAVVKCTHKSGTFNRVIWQTGARRLPEKSFRLFIRGLEKGCYGRKRRSKRRKRNCSGLLNFLELRNSARGFRGSSFFSFSRDTKFISIFFSIFRNFRHSELSFLSLLLGRRDFSSLREFKVQILEKKEKRKEFIEKMEQSPVSFPEILKNLLVTKAFSRVASTSRSRPGKGAESRRA